MVSHRTRAALLTAIAVVASAAVPLVAQRGFGGRFRGGQTTSGNPPYDGTFTFVRMAYPYFGGRGAPWAHDYPVGEEHFLTILTTVTNVRTNPDESAIMSFGDPELFKFPVAYLVEPGFWELTGDEVVALRTYLLKGGFLIVDDFPSRAWGQFELQMGRVFPEGRWIDLGPEHQVFHSFFEVDPYKILSAYPGLGGAPVFRALFKDNDPAQRMYAIANFQNDISEYWEASETTRYVVDETNEAYKIGVNQFIYGITH